MYALSFKNTLGVTYGGFTEVLNKNLSRTGFLVEQKNFVDVNRAISLHPEPLYSPIRVKEIIPTSLGTRSQRINPWIPADEPAATICRTAAGYELKEAQIKPTCQSYRVLTGQEPKRHFGLVRLDPEKPCPTIQKSSPQSSTTGLIHPYEVRHLTISEIKLMSSFPVAFRLEGSFVERWARIGNSVPPLLMRAIAEHICSAILGRREHLLQRAAQSSFCGRL